MKSKSVVKAVALAAIPLTLAVVVAQVGERRRAEREAAATRELERAYGLERFVLSPPSYPEDSDLVAYHFPSVPGQRFGHTEVVLAALASAKSHIFIQAPVMDSPDIAQALLDARKRGVASTAVMLSRRESVAKTTSLLPNRRVLILRDDLHGRNHNNVIRIDDRLTIVGTFDFMARDVQRTTGSVLVIKSRSTGQSYEYGWDQHLEHAKLARPTE